MPLIMVLPLASRTLAAPAAGEKPAGAKLLLPLDRLVQKALLLPKQGTRSAPNSPTNGSGASGPLGSALAARRRRISEILPTAAAFFDGGQAQTPRLSRRIAASGTSSPDQYALPCAASTASRYQSLAPASPKHLPKRALHEPWLSAWLCRRSHILRAHGPGRLSAGITSCRQAIDQQPQSIPWTPVDAPPGLEGRGENRSSLWDHCAKSTVQA